MKNVFFALAFMLISSINFASTNVEKGLITKSLSDIETMIMDFESPNISVINETILELNEELMSACCTVSDGHYEATYCDDRGNYRRACRKARRALKQELGEEAAISAH